MTSIAFPRCCYWNMCKETQHNWYVLETLEVSCCSYQLHRRLESGIFISYDHISKYQKFYTNDSKSIRIGFIYLFVQQYQVSQSYQQTRSHSRLWNFGRTNSFYYKDLEVCNWKKMFITLLLLVKRIEWSGTFAEIILDWLTRRISILRLLDHFCRQWRWYRLQTHYLSRPFQPCFCIYDESIH